MAEKIVNIRPKAMDHLQELRKSQGAEGDIFLRMGVRSGGCSGLSYIMDLVKKVRNTSDSVSMAFLCRVQVYRSPKPIHNALWVWSFESERLQVPVLVPYTCLMLHIYNLR